MMPRCVASASASDWSSQYPYLRLLQAMNISKKILLSTLVVAGSVASFVPVASMRSTSRRIAHQGAAPWGQLRDRSLLFPQLQLIVPAASSATSSTSASLGYLGPLPDEQYEVEQQPLGLPLHARGLDQYALRYPRRTSTPSSVRSRRTQGRGISYAWALINRVGLMHRLTDLYGPIPYTQIEGEPARALRLAGGCSIRRCSPTSTPLSLRSRAT